MKKKLLALLLCVAMMAMTLVGCGGSGDEGKGESEGGDGDAEALNIAVFYYTYSDAYIASVRNALDAEFNAAGIKFQNYDCENNQTKQNEQIDTAIQMGANLLVVNVVTSSTPDVSKDILSKAETAGIPVIFFNRSVEGEKEGEILGSYEKCAFVGTDAPEAGHLQGKMIGDYVLANYDAVDLNGDGQISYAMFMGEKGNAEAIYRTQYGVEDADAVLTEAGKPALVYFDKANADKYQVDTTGAWSTAAALDYMNTNLSQYNEQNGNMIEIVICNNDGMAEGVVSALNDKGYNLGDGGKTIPVFGVDATDSAKELIAQGKMTGTIKQDAEGMAAQICELAENVADGNDLLAKVSTGTASKTLANKIYIAYATYTGEE